MSSLGSLRRTNWAKTGRRKPSVSKSSSSGEKNRRLYAAVEALEPRRLLTALLPAQQVDFQVASEVPIPVADRPYGPVDLLDLNNNGKLDIVYLGGSSVNTMLGNGDGTFAPPVIYPVVGGTGSHSEYYGMQVADLNGDGQANFEGIVVLECPKTAGSAGTINIFTPNSDGTLKTLGTYAGSAGNGPALIGAYSLAIGHLDGANEPADIVVTDRFNRTVTVLTGLGNGKFSNTMATFSVGFEPEAVTIADVNGDGRPDIVVGNAGDNSMSILINDPTHAGGFDPQVVIPNVTGNVTGNGNFHFTTIYNSGTDFPGTTEIEPEIVSNTQTFVDTTVPGQSPTFNIVNSGGAETVAAIDLGGDGYDSLKYFYDTGTVQVGVGSAGGGFTTTGIYSTVAQSITYNTAGTVANITSNATLGYGPVGIAVGYVVNGVNESEYSPDIVVVDHGIDTSGVSSSSQAYAPAITVLKATGNNKFAAEKVTQVGLGTDANGYPANGAATTNPYSNSVLVAEVGGDGPQHQDIIEVNYGQGPKITISNYAVTYTASNYPGSVTVLINQGGGHFSEENIPDFYGPDAVAVGDINGDGIPDLVVAQRAGYGKIAIFAGNANGTFATAPFETMRVGNHPQAVAVAALSGNSDVNGLGNVINDIIVANYGTPYSKKGSYGAFGSVMVITNNGYGNLGISQNIPDLYGPSAMAVADLNGDGFPDIAVTNRLTIKEGIAGSNNAGTAGTDGDTVRILFGNGDGTFQAYNNYYQAVVYPVGNGPSAIIAANLDGNYAPPDLVVLNEKYDSISVLTGVPSDPGTFQNQKVYDLKFFPGSGGGPNPNDSSPVGLAVADINGDGLPDVIVTYGGTAATPGSQVAIFLNLGYAANNYLSQTPILVPVSGVQLDTVGTNTKAVNSIPVAVAVADVNGDGRADVIALDSNGLKYDGEISTLLQGAPLIGPTVTSVNHKTFNSGTAGTFTITTSGAPAATLSETGALPSGVKFTNEGNGTAKLAGTPGATAGGKYVITISATNGYAPNGSQVFTLTVDQAPTISSTAGTSFTAGTPSSFTITTTGFPTDSITETGALPSGVTFVNDDNGKATLAGTPAAGTGGIYDITITASNGFLPNASQMFTLTVDQAPTITSGAAATFATGTAATPFTVTTTGVPNAALTETGSLPSGVSFTDNGNGTATLAGTPESGTGGTYDLTITANNGITPNATQAFTLTIDQSPGFSSFPSTSFVVGVAGTFTVTTSGFPGDHLSEMGSLPSGVTFVDNGNGTATLAGTPAAGTSGVYDLTLDAANGIGTDATQAFTLTVDQPPAISSAAAVTFTVGAAVSPFTITTTGLPAAALMEVGTLPRGITFTDNGNGTATLAGDPASGTGGVYDLTIAANNGVSPGAMQTFTLTIDQAPVITSAAAATFNDGVTASFTVTTSAFPIASLGVSGSLPPGIDFTDNGNGTGTISGTPTQAGKFKFSILANGIGAGAVQMFKLIVNPSIAPTFTSANTTTFQTDSGETFLITTSGVPNAAISELGALPSGVIFTDNGNGSAILSGEPVAGSGGRYKLVLTAANGNAPNAVQVFKLFVDEAPSFSSANSVTFGVASNNAFTVSTIAYPIARIVEIGGLPQGVNFVDNGNGTATLAGTPAAGTAGVYDFTVKAKNGIAPNAKQFFTLTVQGPPAITSAAGTTFTTGASGSFTITTAGFPLPVVTESGTLPNGVSFQNNGDGTATIFGTPGPLTGGTYVLTFGAVNGIGPFASQTFTLTVDEPPAFTSSPQTTFIAGQSNTFSVSAVAFPNAAIHVVGSLPGGVNFHDNGNGTATLSGSPGAQGTFNFKLKAKNGVGATAVQPFTLTVASSIAGVAALPALLSSTSSDTLVGGSADSAVLAGD